MIYFLAYIIGSIPFGYLIAKTKKIDIRQHGSGNIGATNVFRVLGKKWGKLCFSLDFSKGLIPVYFFQLYLSEVELIKLMVFVILLILGHCFSIFLKFNGGKGIAVGAGALFILTPKIFITCFILWLIIYKMTKIVAVASIFSSLLLPCLSLIYNHWDIENGADKFFYFYLFIAIFFIFTHRVNLKRLIAKEEFKFNKE